MQVDPYFKIDLKWLIRMKAVGRAYRRSTSRPREREGTILEGQGLARIHPVSIIDPKDIRPNRSLICNRRANGYGSYIDDS